VERSVGDESVVIGTGVPDRVGDRSVVIGATDDRGNTIIRGGTAAGYNARADSTSVAVGAHAGAGGDVMAQLRQLQELLERDGHADGAAAAAQLALEVQTPAPDRSRAARLWTAITVFTTGGEALMLTQGIARALGLPL
jgi:hypothetical protein